MVVLTKKQLKEKVDDYLEDKLADLAITDFLKFNQRFFGVSKSDIAYLKIIRRRAIVFSLAEGKFDIHPNLALEAGIYLGHFLTEELINDVVSLKELEARDYGHRFRVEVPMHGPRVPVEAADDEDHMFDEFEDNNNWLAEKDEMKKYCDEWMIDFADGSTPSDPSPESKGDGASGAGADADVAPGVDADDGAAV